MNYDEFWWYMMIYDDIWWYLMNYDEFWWYMMIYDDIWWIMMNFDDIWWYMMIYDDIWWYLMNYDEFWWYMMNYDEFGWYMMIFDELWWIWMIYDDIWYIFRNHPSKSLRCWKLPKTWDNQGLMGLRLLRRHTGRRVVIQRNSHALQAFLGTKTAWEAYATRNSSRSCMIHQLIRGLPVFPWSVTQTHTITSFERTLSADKCHQLQEECQWRRPQQYGSLLPEESIQQTSVCQNRQ